MTRLWSIDDVDPQGNLGLTVLMARSEQEARAKFDKLHKGYLKITSIETCFGMSLAMWDAKNGTTGYLRRAKVTAVKP